MEPTNIPTAPVSQGFDFKEFISFRKMITLQIIQIIYIIGAICITLAALFIMFGGGGMFMYGGGGLASFLIGLIYLVLGNIFFRVWCELIIVFFRINKTLTNIENNTKM